MANLPLDLLIKTLLQQYFLPSNGIILISSYLSSKFTIPFGTPLITFEVNDTFSPISLKFSYNYSCQNFILNVHQPGQALNKIEEDLSLSTERFNNRKYIVISDTARNISEIFKTKAIKFLNNILVITCDEKINTVNLALKPEASDIVCSFWTHQYSATTKENEPYLLDKWFSKNESFITKANLFPNKLKNLYGRNVRVGTFEYPPYIIIDNSTAVPTLLGSELKILTTFLDKINGTLELVNQEDLWGYVFENGSSYGLRGNILKDRIDIGAAGLFLSAKALQYFDNSITYMRIELICLVPVPRLATLWLSVIHSFTEQTWLLIALTYFLIGIIVFCFNYITAHTNQVYASSRRTTIKLLVYKTVGSVVRPLISQSMSQSQFYAKPFLSLVLLSTMIISVAYNSKLTSIMTKPVYEHSIKTIDDFLNSDIPWGGLQVADWIVEWKNEKEGRYKRAGERYVAASTEELRQFSLKGNFAFKIERLYDQFHIDSYLQEDIVHKYKPMKDSLWVQYCVLIFRRNSVLVPEINRMILRMVESGLVNYWIQEGASYKKSAFQKKLEEFKTENIYEPVQLKFIHVSGVFYLWILGNIISLVLFLTEKAYFVYCKR